MPNGYLRLTFRDDGDGTGKLVAEAAAGGYSGASGAYFGIGHLQEFARSIAEFPLPDVGRCSLAGGFGSKQNPGELEQEHLGIDVYPVDHRGHIGIQIRMATEMWSDTRPRFQKTAKIEIITTYEPIARFSKDLLAMLDGTASEALLVGEMLP
jgi:hypothetical protein